jgi:hypothetical protein
MQGGGGARCIEHFLLELDLIGAILVVDGQSRRFYDLVCFVHGDGVCRSIDCLPLILDFLFVLDSSLSSF